MVVVVVEVVVVVVVVVMVGATVVVVVVTTGVVWACAGTTTVRRIGFVQDDGRTIAAAPAAPAILSSFLRVELVASRESSVSFTALPPEQS